MKQDAGVFAQAIGKYVTDTTSWLGSRVASQATTKATKQAQQQASEHTISRNACHLGDLQSQECVHHGPLYSASKPPSDPSLFTRDVTWLSPMLPRNVDKGIQI
jgi:hypothetical protein